MGSSTLFTSLPKLGHIGAAIARRSTTFNPTLLFASNPKFIHTNLPQEPSEAKDAINPGANEGMLQGENMLKNMDYSTSGDQHVSQRAKETAERAKDKLAGTAQDVSEEFVKANAKCVENSMNTKNRS